MINKSFNKKAQWVFFYFYLLGETMITKNTEVCAVINERVKDEAAAVLSAKGLTVSDAIRIFLTSIASDKYFPLEPLVPNDETIQAMNDARAGKFETFDSVDSLFDSVLDAIEDTSEEAENMKLRSTLMIILKKHIESTGIGHEQAAKLFGVTQSKISDLMCGKINLFSLDVLVNMATTAGLYVEIKVVKGE